MTAFLMYIFDAPTEAQCLDKICVYKSGIFVMRLVQHALRIAKKISSSPVKKQKR